MKLLVKQMPSLEEGIQYVGMVRPFEQESNLIITDRRGIIDSISENFSRAIEVKQGLFKAHRVNIQLLIPEIA